MLVITRKVGEQIRIGDDVTLTVVKIGSGGVRLGIDAPEELGIARSELAETPRGSSTGLNDNEENRATIPISEARRSADGGLRFDGNAEAGGGGPHRLDDVIRD